MRLFKRIGEFEKRFFDTGTFVFQMGDVGGSAFAALAEDFTKLLGTLGKTSRRRGRNGFGQGAEAIGKAGRGGLIG